MLEPSSLSLFLTLNLLCLTSGKQLHIQVTVWHFPKPCTATDLLWCKDHTARKTSYVLSADSHNINTTLWTFSMATPALAIMVFIAQLGKPRVWSEAHEASGLILITFVTWVIHVKLTDNCITKCSSPVIHTHSKTRSQIFLRSLYKISHCFSCQTSKQLLQHSYFERDEQYSEWPVFWTH